MSADHIRPAESAVRTAQVSDAAALSRFAAAIFPLGCPADADPAELNAHIRAELSPQRFVSFIEDKDVSILLAEVDSKVAGCLLFACHRAHPLVPAKHPYEIEKLYVDPAFHGRGIADALMSTAISGIEAQSADIIWLSVYSGNPRAIRFYQRWGFDIAGTHDFVMGTERHKDYVMRRGRG